jgi:gas vesicle protein
MVSNMDYMGQQKGMAVGTLLLGILIGAAAGGIATLLLAPRSGKETREMLRGKAMETQEMLASRYQDVKEKVGKVTQSMRSAAEKEMQSVDQGR